MLLRHAGSLLDRADAALLELGGLRYRLEGRVAIGAFPSALGVLVPRALANLRRRHPAVVTIRREGSTPTHLRRLRGAPGGCRDRGRRGPAALPALLIEGRLLVTVPETHRLARRGTVDVAELEGEAWIVGDGGDGPQFGVWPGLSDTSRIAYTVRDWTARLGLVAVGLGPAVIPTVAADTVPSGVRLIAVDDPRPVQRSAVVVTRPDRSPSVEALVRALREEGSAIARSVGQSGP